MPLTPFQEQLAIALSENRTPDSYLAGGAAIHFEPNSKRTSNDLDYFHDSEERVATAFAEDRKKLDDAGYKIRIQITQPGFIRAEIGKNGLSTKVEWAHDSSWRFMPTIPDPRCGYLLHPIDLAINKVLALAGRDEARDLIDTLHVHRDVLSLGALCWAAPGKDPGFSPHSLLELLRRRGHLRQEDINRLMLKEPPTPAQIQFEWRQALEAAETFVKSRPPQEIGCLYYSRSRQSFVIPESGDQSDIVPHYGQPGGVLPAVGVSTLP